MKHNAFSSISLLVLGGLLLAAACSKQPVSERDAGQLARYVLSGDSPAYNPITVDVVYDDQGRVAETFAHASGPDSANVWHCYYFFNSQNQCVRRDVRTGNNNTLSTVEEFVYEQGKHVRTNRYWSPDENAPLPVATEYDLFVYSDNSTIEERNFSNNELVQVVVHQLNSEGLVVARTYQKPDGTVFRNLNFEYFNDANPLNFTPGVAVADTRLVRQVNGLSATTLDFAVQKAGNQVTRYESPEPAVGPLTVTTFEYE